MPRGRAELNEQLCTDHNRGHVAIARNAIWPPQNHVHCTPTSPHGEKVRHQLELGTTHSRTTGGASRLCETCWGRSRCNSVSYCDPTRMSHVLQELPRYLGAPHSEVFLLRMTGLALPIIQRTCLQAPGSRCQTAQAEEAKQTEQDRRGQVQQVQLPFPSRFMSLTLDPAVAVLSTT